MKKLINNRTGQTLVTLLIFMVMMITITGAAVALSINNSISADKFAIGIDSYTIAESGVENALIRLLRDPNYTGETINVGDGTATITVTGDITSKTIISSGKINNFARKIELRTAYNDGMLSVLSWREIP